MANGDYSREDAVRSDEAFRQYVVVNLDRTSQWIEQHRRWHEARERSLRWWIGLAIGTPGTLMTGYLLFKLAVATTGVGEGQ